MTFLQSIRTGIVTCLEGSPKGCPTGPIPLSVKRRHTIHPVPSMDCTAVPTEAKFMGHTVGLIKKEKVR